MRTLGILNMSSIEDRLRSSIQSSEIEVKDVRQQIIGFLTFANGKFNVDSRFQKQFNELKSREQALMAKITKLESIFTTTLELTSGIPDIDRSHPYSTLKEKILQTKKNLEHSSTQLELHRRRAAAPIKTILSTEESEFRNRMKTFERDVKQLQQSLNDLNNVIKKAEPLWLSFEN